MAGWNDIGSDFISFASDCLIKYYDLNSKDSDSQFNFVYRQYDKS